MLASVFNLLINNISNNNENFHHTHLALYSCVYLSGCSQFKQVETSSSWFGLVHCTWQVGIVWLVASLLLWTSTRKVVQDRSEWTKALWILPTRALNYCVQKWKDCNKYLGNRLFMFRTWIVRQHNPVWVRKLADSVASLGSNSYKGSIEYDTYFGIIGIIN